MAPNALFRRRLLLLRVAFCLVLTFLHDADVYGLTSVLSQRR